MTTWLVTDNASSTIGGSGVFAGGPTAGGGRTIERVAAGAGDPPDIAAERPGRVGFQGVEQGAVVRAHGS